MTRPSHILWQPRVDAISAMLELGAYEWLWNQHGASTKPFASMAALFRRNPRAFPSDLVNHADAIRCAHQVMDRFKQRGVASFGIRLRGLSNYPGNLHDAANPPELLYFQGEWDLVLAPKRVSIIGTRRPSRDGLRRTRRLTRLLVRDGYTIVSGLAKGIDTAAHEAAIAEGGKTIAVIGTPIDQAYPRENAALQQRIAREFLLISQVPVLLHARRSAHWNRPFFRERNGTMSALTDATVIVEASDTSGTLIQARAALAQGRALFILDSNFHRLDLSWPHRLLGLGAIRVADISDIEAQLDTRLDAAARAD